MKKVWVVLALVTVLSVFSACAKNRDVDPSPVSGTQTDAAIESTPVPTGTPTSLPSVEPSPTEIISTPVPPTKVSGTNTPVIKQTQAPKDTPTKAVPKDNKNKAPDFTLQDLDGNNVSLSDFNGKKVFLNFWATFCGPCVAEMPEIEEIYKETKDKDLVILLIAAGQNQGQVKGFIEKKGFTFKVLVDPKGDASEKYGVMAIPTSVFIDSSGNIVDSKLGSMSKEEMYKYINKLK